MSENKYVVKWKVPSTGETGTVKIMFSTYEDALRLVNAQKTVDETHKIEMIWEIECVST